MNNIEKSIKNLSEIVQASEDDIKNNNKNVTAILDLEDLKSLKTMLQEFNKLKQDNYKLDRENQLLFEKQVNPGKKENQTMIMTPEEALKILNSDTLFKIQKDTSLTIRIAIETLIKDRRKVTKSF